MHRATGPARLGAGTTDVVYCVCVQCAQCTQRSVNRARVLYYMLLSSLLLLLCRRIAIIPATAAVRHDGRIKKKFIVTTTRATSVYPDALVLYLLYYIILYYNVGTRTAGNTKRTSDGQIDTKLPSLDAGDVCVCVCV